VKSFAQYLINEEKIQKGFTGRLNRDIKSKNGNVIFMQSEEISIEEIKGEKARIKKIFGGEKDEMWIDKNKLSKIIHLTSADAEGLRRDK
jgi:hypothetical protein